MVADELIPLLAQEGLGTARIGLFGWSMGGYGALLLAGNHAIPGLRAVSTLSAALWTKATDSVPGAFDDAADFEAHDVFAHRDRLDEFAVRMDCGSDDPFAAANRTFRTGLGRPPQGGQQPGAHTTGYWRRMAADHLAFMGGVLNRGS